MDEIDEGLEEEVLNHTLLDLGAPYCDARRMYKYIMSRHSEHKVYGCDLPEGHKGACDFSRFMGTLGGR